MVSILMQLRSAERCGESKEMLFVLKHVSLVSRLELAHYDDVVGLAQPNRTAIRKADKMCFNTYPNGCVICEFEIALALHSRRKLSDSETASSGAAATRLLRLQ
jgi:hypothetical protein